MQRLKYLSQFLWVSNEEVISLSVSNAGFLCCSQDISQGFSDLETKLVFEDPVPRWLM